MTGKVSEKEIMDNEFQQCPFCDRLFEKSYRIAVTTELEEHIRTQHGRVKVWRGRNVRWCPASEVRKKMARAPDSAQGPAEGQPFRAADPSHGKSERS